MESWENWTSCEMYGHVFVDGHCSDCGEGDGEVDEAAS